MDTYLGKNITNYVQHFHEPPSLRPHCSSLSTVGQSRAGTKLHPIKGVPNQADVSQTTGKTLSQVPTQTNTLLDHVVIDANGLITWDIVGSYVIDVNGLV
jgi:hypothetical protein